MMQDMLEELGFAVLGPAGSVAAALMLLEGTRPTAAVLDCNLGHEKVWPVAEWLQRERVPFVFSTGYGAPGVHSALRGGTGSGEALRRRKPA